MKNRPEVRTRHDEWTKRALALWLGALGDVQLDARIAGHSRRADVLYVERRKAPAHRRRLGLLGDLARGNLLLEPFRNPVTGREIRACVLKAVDHEAQQVRAGRRSKQKPSTLVPAGLCLITPSLSADLTAEAEVTQLDAHLPGVYRLATLWNTVIVVAAALPENAATLWLRLLGRGEVQARAVSELLALRERHPLRDATFQLLIAWQQS